MIDLLLLGNGSMQPLPDRWLSSLLIRVRSELFLFDCGEGTQIVYRKFGWGFRRLSTICLSHIHADHTAGLPGILTCVANAGRGAPVTIYGPRGTREIVAGLTVVCPTLPYELRVIELGDGDEAQLPAGLRATVLESEQRGVPVLVYRFDLARKRRFDHERASALGIPQRYWRQLQEGEAVAFEGHQIEADLLLGPPRPGLAFGVVTDTRPRPDFAGFFRDVDLLVSEATYLDDADLAKAVAYDHFTLSEACALAQEANARRLLLTHFSAAYGDPPVFGPTARVLFPPAEIGTSGWTATLAFRDV